MKKKSVLSKFIGGGIKKAAALGLTAVAVGTSFLGMSDTAFAANSDIARIVDRYGNEVDVNNGFEFGAYSEYDLTFTGGFNTGIPANNTYTVTAQKNPNGAWGPNSLDLIFKDGSTVCWKPNTGKSEYNGSTQRTIGGIGTMTLKSWNGTEENPTAVVIEVSGVEYTIPVGGNTQVKVGIEPSASLTNPVEPVAHFEVSNGDVIDIDFRDYFDTLTSGSRTITLDTGKHKYGVELTVSESYGNPQTYRVAFNTVDGGKSMTFPGGADSMYINSANTVSKCVYTVVYEDINNLPDRELNIVCLGVGEQPNSTNNYNFLLGHVETVDISKGQKFEVDFSKINDIMPVEKREFYEQHLEDLDAASEVLFGGPWTITDNASDATFSYLSGAQLFGKGFSIDDANNYRYSSDNLVYDKTISGYTATEDFEFLLIAPVYGGDFKTRYNVAVPNSNLEYQQQLYSYTLLDYDRPVDFEYLANMLKNYLQLTVPYHTGEDKYYRRFESVTSQIEKENTAEVGGAYLWGKEGTDALSLGLMDSLSLKPTDEEIDAYIDNIIKNSGGVFEEEAEHLRKCLKTYDWYVEFHRDLVAKSEELEADIREKYDVYDYWNNKEANAEFEAKYKVLVDEYVQNVVDAGYTHNDLALMHLASAGAALGLPDASEIIKSDYEKLVERLGIADKVEWTAGGIPKITLKAGENITFNKDDYSEDCILIYEKAYDDTEKVINRTWKLGRDDEGCVNIYAGGSSEEPGVVENTDNTVDESSETVTDKPTEAAGTEAKEEAKKENIKETNRPVSNTEAFVEVKKQENTESPKTGDNINYTWIILGAISGISLVSAILFKKFKKEV